MMLAEIKSSLQNIRAFVDRLVGVNPGPLVITNDAAKNAALENVVAYRDLKKCVDEYFDPIIQPVKAELDALRADKAAWIEPIESGMKALNAAVTEYNNKIREQENARRLEQAQADAEKTGQDAPEYIPTTQVKTINEFITGSETAVIEEFRITDTLMVIEWAIASGLGGALKLDKTSETAIKKYINDRPDMTAVPGAYFKRGWRQNVKAKRG